MGKFGKGIHPFSSQVGNMVGSSWSGMEVMKRIIQERTEISMELIYINRQPHLLIDRLILRNKRHEKRL